MKTAVVLVQIVLAVMLIATVLIQARGTGLGSPWGGTGESYRSKRGVEKILFFATIIVAALFLLVSVINVFITQ